MTSRHKSRHKGPILSMSWKASLEVNTRLGVGEGARMRLPQLLAQVGAGSRVLLLFQEPMIDPWLAEMETLLSSGYKVSAMSLADGEHCKSVGSLTQVWNVLQKERFDRHD